MSFFMYKTTSKVVLDSKDTINSRRIPNTLLCMTYTDILDLQSLNHKYGTNFTRSKNFNAITKMQSQLTLNHIFDFTPGINDTIQSCTHRITNGLLMEKDDRDSCYSKFHAYRFYVQSFMCYGFKYNGVVNFTSKQVANSLYDPNLLYSVTLGPKFSGADMVMVSLFYGTYPSTSRQYSVLVNRLSDFASLEVRNTMYIFGYAANQVQLLEAPYETMCSNHVNDTASNLCRNQCFKPVEDEIDRVFFTTMITEGIDKKHINYYDLNDKKKRVKIRQRLEYCTKKCVDRPCNYNYTITYFDMAMKKSGSQDMTIVARTAKAAGLNVKFEAKLPLMEFIIYICSCIGIWFGLSVISLNPFEPRLRRKLHEPIIFFSQIMKKCSKGGVRKCR